MKSENLRRGLSVVTLYALLIQQVVPFGLAAGYRTSIALTSNSTIHVDENPNSSKIEGFDHVEEIEISEHLQSVSTVTSGGSGQAETSGYSLGSTNDLVDKFTGDFSYSIPLMDVEGYPIVLNYNSNVGMHSEASWVGLGWTLNVGSVSRDMRGIPDEFNGEQNITRTYHQRESTTTGVKSGYFVALSKEHNFTEDVADAYGNVTPQPTGTAISGSLGLTFLVGGYYSTMLGFGRTLDINLNGALSMSNENKYWSVGPNYSIGYSSDSKNGLGTSSSIGLAGGYGKEHDRIQLGIDVNYGKSYNSRVGTTSRSLGLSATGGYYTCEGYYNGQDQGAIASFGTSMSIPFGTQSSVPKVPLSSRTNGFQLNTKSYVSFGVGGMKLQTGNIYQVYNTDNEILIQNNTISQPALGYFHNGKRSLYTSNIESGEYPVMDFDRGTSFEYSEEMANLDFSMQTYDIFRVNAAGTSGAYRGKRTDYGTYFDATKESSMFIDSYSPEFGVETTPPALVVGFTFGANKGVDESGNFVTNSGDNILNFEEQPKSNQIDQTVYFKAIGEPTPEDLAVFNNLKEVDPIKIELLVNPDNEIQAMSSAVGTDGVSVPLNSSTINSLTQKITQSNYFEPVIAEAMSSNYRSYHFNNFDYGTNFKNLSRTTTERADNHISAIKTTTNSGIKYVYGIPAYNLSSSEAIFSVTGRTVDTDENMVTYNSADNSTSNNLGRSALFDQTTVPAYAHSFLLTEMLSSDYLDISGNGPSVDDIGTWYQFNYSQVYGNDDQDYGSGTVQNDPYTWRYPVSGEANQAIFVPGMQGTDFDDLASISYGEKEVWYTHSVESKNMIAEFHLAPREDAYASVNKNGQLDLSKPLYYIERIELYNRSERINNPNATPVQVVTFEYDYSLCKKAPGNKFSYAPNYDYNKSGKLTLKKIRVYSGNSEETALSSYDFTYSSEVRDFDYADADAWGNYKENIVAKQNKFFPYAEQNETTANSNIQAWKLVNIKTPMGGELIIDYEADRYTHVQDKKAMRHFEIAGMTNLIELMKGVDAETYNPALITADYNTNYSHSTLTTMGGLAFATSLVNDNEMFPYEHMYGRMDNLRIPNNVILFELETPILAGTSLPDASDQIKEKYFDNLNGQEGKDRGIYFKIETEVNKEGETVNHDYIPVYAEISYNRSGIFNGASTFTDNFQAIGALPPASTNGQINYGYVVINPANVGEKAKKDNPDIEDTYMAHPFQKAAIEHARMNLPDKTFGACPTCETELGKEIDKELIGKRDVNREMIKLEYAERLKTGLSVVRLYEPDGVKFGGGARVSKITYKDNWDAISGEYGSTYYWTYKYAGRGLESGVAAFEPMGILDECALYRWDTYTDFKHKYADERKITPTPLGASLFPNPIVGYQEVEVFFSDQYDRGYSETKFYTAKDFPTIENKTAVDKGIKVEKKNPLVAANLYGFSQGFTLITNDFHGKIKSETIYNDQGSATSDGNIISKSVYEYYGLNDQQKVIDRDGTVRQANLGLEYDIHSDANFVTDKSWSASAGASVTMYQPIPITGFKVSPNVSFSMSRRGFYSTTIVKHINQYAILNRVNTEYLGSKNSAENLAFDSETGAVIVSSLKDEFNDPLYSYGMPAHWYYKQFRNVAETKGKFFGGTITSNALSASELEDFCAEGDQLIIENSQSQTASVWILEFDAQGDAILINDNGTAFSAFSGTVTVYLTNSGRENILMATMQSIVTKETPDITTPFKAPDTHIISGSAVTLRDRNNVKCYVTGDKGGLQVQEDAATNPFVIGAKGKLVPDGGYAWRSPRENQHAHGIRFDGTYSSFKPMFQLNTTDLLWHRIDESGYTGGDQTMQSWKKMGEISLFDEFGRAVESKDQIRVNSAVLFGYNKELGIVPVAQAVNAKKQNIAFDGFEDYNYYANMNLSFEERHFDFKDALNANVQITETFRHSGLSSLQVASGTTASQTVNIAQSCGNPTNGIVEGEFKPQGCLCIPPFEPSVGKYILGAWVKVGDRADVTSYTGDVRIEVQVSGGNPILVPMNPSGPILDGWQRIEGTFEFTGTATTLTFNLKNLSQSELAYFDDFRIHPYLAGMTTTVYDPKTLLPLATHDGYNFTTFYNYDENLNLTRVRVETIEGIKTVSETEVGGQKSFVGASQGQ